MSKDIDATGTDILISIEKAELDNPVKVSKEPLLPVLKESASTLPKKTNYVPYNPDSSLVNLSYNYAFTYYIVVLIMVVIGILVYFFKSFLDLKRIYEKRLFTDINTMLLVENKYWFWSCTLIGIFILLFVFYFLLHLKTFNIPKTISFFMFINLLILSLGILYWIEYNKVKETSDTSLQSLSLLLFGIGLMVLVIVIAVQYKMSYNYVKDYYSTYTTIQVSEDDLKYEYNVRYDLYLKELQKQDCIENIDKKIREAYNSVTRAKPADPTTLISKTVDTILLLYKSNNFLKMKCNDNYVSVLSSAQFELKNTIIKEGFNLRFSLDWQQHSFYDVTEIENSFRKRKLSYPANAIIEMKQIGRCVGYSVEEKKVLPFLCRGKYKSAIGYYDIRETLEVQKLYSDFANIPKGTLITILPTSVISDDLSTSSMNPSNYEPDHKVTSFYNNKTYDIPIKHFLIYQAFKNAQISFEEDKKKEKENITLAELDMVGKLESALNNYLSEISRITRDIVEKQNQLANKAVQLQEKLRNNIKFTEKDSFEVYQLQSQIKEAKEQIVSNKSEYEIIRDDLQKLTDLISMYDAASPSNLSETFKRIDKDISTVFSAESEFEAGDEFVSSVIEIIEPKLLSKR
jgi:hypothetical protein